MGWVAYRFGGAALARRAGIIGWAMLVVAGSCLMPAPTSAQSLDIPLNLTQYGSGYGPNLTINIGIDGQAPRTYLFDTGSPDFVALYSASAFGSVPKSMNGEPKDQIISYADGTRYTFNVVASPSYTFYPSSNATTGGITLNAVSPSGTPSQFLMGAITSFANVSFPEGPLPGVFGGDYGIFGAGNFVGIGPGSVLGQAVLPGMTAGYVVAANGQPLSAMNAGPLQHYASSPNGPQVGQSVTSCSPCVMLGLTPALIAQFEPVNEIHTNAFAKFPNSGVAGTNQYPFVLPITVSGAGGTITVTSRTLLDTGTPSYPLSGKIPDSYYSSGNATVTVSGTASGAAPSTVTLINNTDAATCCNPYYGYSSGADSSTIGLGFFLTNSVLYDLAGQLVGYTSNFVTDVNITTTPTSPLVIDLSSVPLGLAGTISGSGAVEVMNGGSATLSGTSTYTGATIVNNGFLALVGPGSISLSSGVRVSNNGIFDISGVGSGAPAGAFITSLSSTDRAGIVLLGANQLVLTHANGTFGGTIADGGIHGGSGGSLLLAGGAETLSGQSTYTGPTYVDAGTLTVTGSITSAVFVNSGAVLSGGGTVGSTTINAGGLLAPANPGGALTVQGNLVFATAGAYLVEITDAGADRVHVTGSATLAGNVFAVLSAGTVSKQYAILNAGGGTAGTFAGVNNLPATLAGSLGHDGNNVLLNLSLNYNALGSLTTNQQNVANALANSFNAHGSIPTGFATLTQAGLSQAAGRKRDGRAADHIPSDDGVHHHPARSLHRRARQRPRHTGFERRCGGGERRERLCRGRHGAVAESARRLCGGVHQGAAWPSI
jgi:autotransporter-associated beta strand protein